MKENSPQSILLGAHISIAGGLHNAITRAESIGCTTMQIFTKNNKSWLAPNIHKKEITEFKFKLKNSNLSQIMSHSSYLINIGSKNQTVEQKSIKSLTHELDRCEALNIPYLVLHPGSHIGAGEEKCIKQIAKNLDSVLMRKNRKTMILLETMAGQGTNVGHTFEQLKQIYQLCKNKKLLGICFDTCHVFSAGYNIGTPQGYKNTWKKFDTILGFKLLKAIHINDSKTEFNSRKDRHENIGKGTIPLKTFELIMNDKKLSTIPKILETPAINGLAGYKKEITILKNMIQK